jgi:hypothetical protein
VLHASFSKKPSFAKFESYPVSVYHFLLQKVDVLRYMDEEYEKYLVDPVGTSCTKFLECSVPFVSMTCLHFLCY